MTLAEAVLWRELRGRKLGGFKFRAQHPVGQFILDFYCPECRLVIEVDGPVHEGREEMDEARTAHLEAFGYKVVRFTNQEVVCDIESVLARILKMAESRKKHLG